MCAGHQPSAGDIRKERTVISTPLIFHIDVNSAYLSWEAVDRLKKGNSPDLRTIPAIVGGDQDKRHGVVLAKSGIAKKYGVKTGEPIVHALKKCPNLTIIPTNFELYHRNSQAFMEILRRYAPVVEQYSIDEAFADMSGTEKLYGSPTHAAELIRDTINRELAFTINVGISTNKLLAKMASDFEKPNKIHTLFPEEIPFKMWPLDVGELFFVGDAAKRKLNELGIYTIGDLANGDLNMIRMHLKKQGEVIYNYANGIDISDVLHKEPANKGYGNSITLAHDVTDADEAKAVLLSLCETVGARLRADGMKANCVSVQITYNNFVNRSHQCTLSASTNVTTEIYDLALQLFDQLWDRRTPIRLLGVSTSRVSSESYRQYNLFDTEKYEKLEKLDTAVDKIRKKYGEDAIKRARFLEDKKEEKESG